MSDTVQKKLKDYKIVPDKYMQDNIFGDYAVIPISPQVDITCGGGIREGSIVIVSGHEKLGKSTFCLQAAANAQCMNDGIKRKIYFFDVENKLLPRDLKGIRNLDYEDPEKFQVLGSTEEGLVPAETYFNLAESIAKNEPHSIIIVDSFSVLLSKSELSYDFDDGRKRPDVPSMTAIFCKKMMQIVRPTKCIVMGINHVYTSQGVGPAMLQESGGKKLQYACNYKFRLVSKSPEVKDGAIIGNKVNFRCEVHPTDSSTPPKDSYEFFHRFGYGIDDVKDIIDMASLCGIINKKSSWYAYGETNLGQGMEKTREFLEKNQDVLSEIRNKLAEELK